MEHEFATQHRLRGVLAELIAREPIFHHRELVHDRESFERETSPEFWEIGASGRRYSREFVWETLAGRFKGPETATFELSDPKLREIAPQTYLLTYTLGDGARVTRRLTVCQGSAEAGWKILFHQGTLVVA